MNDAFTFDRQQAGRRNHAPADIVKTVVIRLNVDCRAESWFVWFSHVVPAQRMNVEHGDDWCVREKLERHFVPVSNMHREAPAACLSQNSQPRRMFRVRLCSIRSYQSGRSSAPHQPQIIGRRLARCRPERQAAPCSCRSIHRRAFPADCCMSRGSIGPSSAPEECEPTAKLVGRPQRRQRLDAAEPYRGFSRNTVSSPLRSREKHQKRNLIAGRQWRANGLESGICARYRLCRSCRCPRPTSRSHLLPGRADLRRGG